MISAVINRAAFIVGCGHSGTSLLANMFAAHPEVFVPLQETGAFLIPEKVQHRCQWLHDATVKAGRRFLVEKSPRHLHFMETIRSNVPGARFVVMVRDGRDVAASYITREGNAAAGRDRWIRDTLITAAESTAEDVHVLRYEDLIEDPEGRLRTVCAFVGIPFSSVMLRYHEQERLWFKQTVVERGDGTAGAGHRALRNWQINQPIFDGRGKWRGRLPDDVLASFGRGEGRDLMVHFGYDPDDSDSVDVTPASEPRNRQL